jgi:hypothetical protein
VASKLVRFNGGVIRWPLQPRPDFPCLLLGIHVDILSCGLCLPSRLLTALLSAATHLLLQAPLQHLVGTADRLCHTIAVGPRTDGKTVPVKLDSIERILLLAIAGTEGLVRLAAVARGLPAIGTGIIERRGGLRGGAEQQP